MDDLPKMPAARPRIVRNIPVKWNPMKLTQTGRPGPAGDCAMDGKSADHPNRIIAVGHREGEPKFKHAIF
jgi:hypothetical protein